MILLRNRISGMLIPGKFRAMCIWPFVIVKPSEAGIEDMPHIIRHEKIHARQQMEMAWVFFFIWYILEFAVRLVILQNYMKAYQSLAHEKEAHLNDDDTEYLRKRKLFAWIRYL